MLGRNPFVQLDAETGPRRRNHVAVAPFERLLEQLRMEAVEFPDALHDERARTARAYLHAGRRFYGAAPEMRRDVRVMRLGHRRDLLRLQYPAHASERHL